MRATRTLLAAMVLGTAIGASQANAQCLVQAFERERSGVCLRMDNLQALLVGMDA